MKPIFIKDMNRIQDTKYTLEDRFDKHKSFEMAQKYMRYYLPKHWTIEDVAMLWRYGPEGRRHQSKKCSYVKAVKREYRRLVK